MDESTSVEVSEEIHIRVYVATSAQPSHQRILRLGLRLVRHALCLPPFGELSDPAADVDIALDT